jgi:hypothetical protein
MAILRTIHKKAIGSDRNHNRIAFFTALMGDTNDRLHTVYLDEAIY